MSSRSLISLLIGVFLIFVASNSVFIIYENIERGVLLRWGKVVDDDLDHGIHFKYPFVDEVRKFDGRVLTLDARPERFFTGGFREVQSDSVMTIFVDSFTKWRIIDVGRYYTRTQGGNEEYAKTLLGERVGAGLRDEFAKRSLKEVVSGEREQLMTDIKTSLNLVIPDELGVEIIDVRVKKIDLPETVLESVYSQMRAERKQDAEKKRSAGKEQAEIIRAETDKEIIEIRAKAYKIAEELRGEGDAEAAEVYAKAFNKDPEFYAFVRSLEAYTKSFSHKEDIMLLDPGSDFFRYLNDSKGE